MTDNDKYYVGDVGTQILVDTKTDISTATVLQLRVKKPSGEKVTWQGTLGPMNAFGEYTTIKYIVQAGDWDEDGTWKLQVRVVTPNWSGRGNTVTFKLEPEFG